MAPSTPRKRLRTLAMNRLVEADEHPCRLLKFHRSEQRTDLPTLDAEQVPAGRRRGSGVSGEARRAFGGAIERQAPDRDR